MMICAREALVARIVEMLDDEAVSPLTRKTLVEGAVPEKAIALDVLATEYEGIAVDLRVPSTESAATREHALDGALRSDFLAFVCTWAAAALRAEHAEGERQARLALRLLQLVPLVTAPPYVPLEVPWLLRPPAPNEVGPHALAHPVPGSRGALWLASQHGAPRRGALGSAIFELFVDGEHVFSASHRNPATGAPAPLETVNVEGCRWLPLTADLWPAFLLDLGAPIDPTGAPIVHVPTERVLAITAEAERFQRDAAFMAPQGIKDRLEARAALEATELRSVARERDHHARRVGELLSDAGWQLARVRALAKMVPEVRCSLCAWVGWPFACPVHPEGLLLCPECSMPCFDARQEAPDWLLTWLFSDIADLSRAALTTPGDEQPELWARVSRDAEAVVAVARDDAEEHVGQRGAILAAHFAGDTARAIALVERFASAPELSEKTARMLAIYGAALRSGGPLPDTSEVKPQRGIWMCCAQPACVCGVGWMAMQAAERAAAREAAQQAENTAAAASAEEEEQGT